MKFSNRFAHLKKCWSETLLCTFFFVSWFYRVDNPLSSYQIIAAVVSIPLLFAFSDLLFSTRNNWLRAEGFVAEDNNFAVWISIGIVSVGLAASFFVAGYFDLLSADASQYRQYYMISFVLLAFLFKTAYKK